METVRKLSRWIEAINSGTGARAGSIALADQLAASATNFLTGVIVGRACAPQEFGLYMLGFSIVFFAMRLQTALISTPLMVFDPRLSEDDRATYTGSTLVHQATISGITMMALAAFGFVLNLGIGPQQLMPVVWALSAVITFILLKEHVRQICFARMDFRLVFLIDSLIAAIQIPALLCLAASSRLSAGSAFWSIGVASAIAVAYWYSQLKSFLKIEIHKAVTHARQNWLFGRWIFASGLYLEFARSLYPWVLAHYHGTSAVGLWAACFGAVAIGNPLLLGMQNFLGPRIARSITEGTAANLRRSVMQNSLSFSLLLLPFFLVLFFFGGEIVVLLYGKKFDGQGLLVSLLAVEFFFAPLTFSLSRALFVLERSREESMTNVFGLVIFFVLGFWLVKFYSTIGIAVSYLVTDALLATSKMMLLLKYTKGEESRSLC